MIEFDIKDLDLDFHGRLLLNDKGFLDPEITKLDINFGESTITHDNVLVQLFMH